MSGPNYPDIQPSAISLNDFGSDFGSDFGPGPEQIIIPPFDYNPTIISQYANSTRMRAMIDTFSQSVDQYRNIQFFYDRVFNVQTAEGYGLDVWGRIVGASRIVQIPFVGFFQFSETGAVTPFGLSQFYNGGATANNYALSDDDFRRLIYAKARTNISDGSTPDINSILKSLFPGRGNCYVTDTHNASTFLQFAETGAVTPFGSAQMYSGAPQSLGITYTFAFSLSDVEKAIIRAPGVLPKPAGVIATISSL